MLKWISGVTAIVFRRPRAEPAASGQLARRCALRLRGADCSEAQRETVAGQFRRVGGALHESEGRWPPGSPVAPYGIGSRWCAGTRGKGCLRPAAGAAALVP